MATPQPGHPPQGYAVQQSNGPQQPGQHPGNQQPGFEEPTQEQPSAGTTAARRKRQYAGQAYDFGAGGHGAGGAQPQAGGGYPGPQGASYGGHGQQPQQAAYTQSPYGVDQGSPAPLASPTYEQPQPAVGGYQSPDAGYPAHGLSTMQAGMNSISQGMTNLGIGGQSQPLPTQPLHPPQQRPQLNQLYPTDLLNQPFNVAELDLPPPPILLPANVSRKGDLFIPHR